MSGAGAFPRVFGTVVLLKPLSRDARTEVFLALRLEGADRLCVVTFLSPSLVSSAKVVEALKPERSLKYSPLFQVKLVLQNTPQESLALPDLTLSARGGDYAAARALLE